MAERDGVRSGLRLLQAVAQGLQNSPLADRLELRAVRCLSQCRRPCAVALAAPGKFTYLFGDQHPQRAAEALLDVAALYLASGGGWLARERRPRSLRASILGRIPPLDWDQNPVELTWEMTPGESDHSAE